MRQSHLLLTLALCVPATAAAQNESGAFVVRLGTDTIVIESFSRTGGMVDGRFASRVGQFTEWRYAVRLGADGTVQTYDLTLIRASTPNTPTQHRTIAFQRDSAILTIVRGDSTTTTRLAAPQGGFPFLNHSFAMYELLARAARAAGRDTFTTAEAIFGAPRTYVTTVVRVGVDSLVATVDNGLGVRLKADPSGKVLGGNGHGTTQQVDVERRDNLNFQALADAFSTRPLTGPLSPADSVRASIVGASIAIDYSRPSMRGRKVFGGDLVPWDKVWRTGANFATRLTTSADLLIGGQTVPAGTYTLWTLPTPTGWKLIINKQTKAPCADAASCNSPRRANLWGTDYSADSDFVRVDMQVEKLSAPLEQYLMSITPQGAGGVLKLEWETTRAWVAFSKK
jgi:hypothetical protein